MFLIAFFAIKKLSPTTYNMIISKLPAGWLDPVAVPPPPPPPVTRRNTEVANDVYDDVNANANVENYA